MPFDFMRAAADDAAEEAEATGAEKERQRWEARLRKLVGSWRQQRADGTWFDTFYGENVLEVIEELTQGGDHEEK